MCRREQGRGTFVSGKPANNRWLNLATDFDSLVESIRNNVLKRVFIQRDAEPPELIPGAGNHAKAYTFLRSVQFNSGRPFSVVNLHLDQRLFLRDSKRFTRSAALPKIVEMEDIVITHAYQTFTIGVADPETADLLEIGLGEPTADCHLTVMIYNDDGPLRLSNDSFSSNKASITGPYQEEAYGGAVYNDGSSGMTSVHDTYASNTAKATGGSSAEVYGGAVLSYEPFSSSFDSFTSNSATGPYESYGGAIYSDDSTTAINNATISSNVASAPYEGYGGGIYDDDGLAINGSVISGNTATHRGGGLFVDDTETIANTSFTGNKVTGGGYEDGGGAIYNDSSLTLYNSTISGNSATVSGTYAGGGGIYSDDYLAMTASTVSGNAVLGNPPSGSGGGGIFNYDEVVLLNSTVSANSSSVDGGGLVNFSSEYLTNATVFANKATASGGNVSNASTMALANSIVAGGSASIGADISNSSTLTSLDYNIIQTPVAGTPISGTTTHNLQVNPLLLALANNGGPTFTNADQATSPGRADIPVVANLCNGLSGTDFDQRGFARGAVRCDVGAYEFAGVASAGKHQQPIRALPGHRHHPKHKRSPHAKAPVPAAQ